MFKNCLPGSSCPELPALDEAHVLSAKFARSVDCGKGGTAANVDDAYKVINKCRHLLADDLQVQNARQNISRKGDTGNMWDMQRARM